MKSRWSLFVCCLLTTLLVGIRLGQSLRSREDAVAERSTVSPFNSDGWQLAAGQQSGPSASLQSELSGEEALLAESSLGATTGEYSESEKRSREPDITYFPEALREAAGNTGSPLVSHVTKRIPAPASLSAEEAVVWQNELKDLPADQAEAILDLRKQLGSVASESLGFAFPEMTGPAADAPGLFPAIAEAEASPIPLPTATLDSQVTLVSADDDPPIVKKLNSEAASNYLENLANVRTPGFKRRQIVLLNVSITDSAAPQFRAAAVTQPERKIVQPESDASEVDDSTSIPAALTVVASKPARSVEGESVRWLSRLDLRPGEMTPTDNPLDLAISGRGWLKVERDGQYEFVRTGMLGFDDAGRLGIQTGAGLLPLVPIVQLRSDHQRIVIAESGELYPSSTEGSPPPVAQLMPVDFHDASALKRTSVGTYSATNESGPAVAAHPSSVRFLQSFLEESNVDREQEQAALDHLRTVAEQVAQAHRNSRSR